VTLRVAIADDHALFRQGLISMFGLHPDVTVVAELARAADVVSALEQTPCDVLLLDLQLDRSVLPDIEGLAQRAAIVVVTASELASDALAAMRAGARGFVFKRYALETLMDAIRTVRAGGVWMPPDIETELAGKPQEPRAASLTRREREIVRYVALGMRNAEIAQHLGIGDVTVKTHLNNVFQKLGLQHRVQLTLYALRNGMVGIGERGR
jgi:two-component system NarL family response regulator